MEVLARKRDSRFFVVVGGIVYSIIGNPRAFKNVARTRRRVFLWASRPLWP